MIQILLLIILMPLSIIFWQRLNQKFYLLSLVRRVQTQDGSDLESKVCLLPGKTKFGNNFDILNMNPETIFNFMRETIKGVGGRSFLWYFLFTPCYNVVTAEDAEDIFQSTQLVTKNVMYDLLAPFLGDGLLMSSDKKWHFRRKLLTPAFHFNVLQTFLDIFKEECDKLVKMFDSKAGQKMSLSDVIPQFTLNNICETAMGVKLDDMTDGKRYRQAIHDMEPILIKRVCNPLMYYNTIFYLFADYRKQANHLKIVHKFSSDIISQRRIAFKKEQANNDNNFEINFGKKKRYAMLDTLLAAEALGQINHQGICDEVNTFMFEGYDTTSICLIFSILMLALHKDVQKRCYSEIENLADIENLTVFDFNKLDYLECVIKETLRMYPSVPLIGRKCVEDSVVNGMIFPANTQINIHIYDIMRDPRHFPEPNSFKPERFLNKNISNRNPFAFVPFSAGQRNCIGQKFAILEIKVLLVAILRNFQVLPVTKLEDIIFEYGIVLRAQNKVNVKLTRRQ